MSFFSDLLVVVNNDDIEERNVYSQDFFAQLIQLLKQKLINPPCIPFSGRFLYVTSFGKYLQSKNDSTTQQGGIRNPYDVKIDNKLKLVFVADHNNCRIVVFDLDGYYLYHFKTPLQPISLFVDQLKDRILINCGNKIYKCNKKGNYLTKIYENGYLFAITMDTFNENIYITETNLNKIIVIDIDGNFKFEIYSNFKKPSALTFNSKRELLVSDSCNDRIQVFDCNGQFIKSIKGFFNKNWGIVTDKTNDNILVADYINEMVHVLDKDGQLIKSIAKENNEINYPVQLDYCSVNGYVYVCSETRHDIVIFK